MSLVAQNSAVLYVVKISLSLPLRPGFSASPVKDGVTKAALLKEKMLTALCVIYAPLTMVPFS